MYAVIKTGGKQYKAATGDVLIVEKIEAEAGTELEFNHILMVVDGSKVTLGSPLVDGAKVKAKVLRQTKAQKINAFNYKPKKNERKRWGHRQPETHVEVLSVEAGE